MKRSTYLPKRKYKGLVVLDVDGVLFKDIFLKKIVQSKGITRSLKMLLLGIKYYLDKITINSLLVEGYRLAGTFDANKAQVTAEKIRRVTHIKETVEILRREGFYVSLISAGIPGFVLRNLSDEIGADHYTGIDIDIKGGSIVGSRISLISKIEIVETLLKDLKLRWEDVISVADDPNNVELLKRSGKGIGFNPSRVVRRYSDVVIEGNDFLEILPHIVPKENLQRKYRLQRFIWKREFFRKGIHIFGSLFALLALHHKMAALLALGGIIVLYLLSELSRILGVSVVFLSYITKKAQRKRETRGIIFGPVLLGCGMLITILIYDFKVYLPAILIVSVSDTLSALVGMRFGKTLLFGLKNRTLIGSSVFFLSACLILYFTVPLRLVLPAAVLSTLIEIIPYYNIDNFLIPLVTATFLNFSWGV
jgi:dolichol kinase/phosphoserine phosphatase